MVHTNLRKVGGSIMLAVPPALLKKLGLDAGKEVSLDVQDGKLLIEPKKKPSYKLADLLKEHQELNLEQDAWNDMKPVGREEI
ncbi:AbrB/MazE/SpoVT family DNA-binding domain-containing protein [Acinetobacter boissieri]|uniref:Antitoxin ChpS n=1 Tax=Acinetobacter boissieri TaxID=1219383 RepID=A0A1G6KI06_9GAMM|nr:AbrB/MazE/SpoVT family DNA-binding domain-containing protein [Acinetobacter boissieri]SDC29946.1 antitoxin ChpS [Acinetobacter boissieri]